MKRRKKKERIKKRTHKKGKENKEIQREESILKKRIYNKIQSFPFLFFIH